MVRTFLRNVWNWPTIAVSAAVFPLIGVLTTIVEPWVRGDRRELALFLDPSWVIWIAWALLVPLFLRVEERFPLNRRNARTWLVHSGLLLAFIAVHITLAAILDIAGVRLIIRDGELSRWLLFDRIPRYLPLDLGGYAVTMAAAYGFRAYTRMRDREKRQARMQTRLLRAQVQLLRTRLDPDLLLETLETIAAEIETHPDLAERHIEIVGEFLERVLAQVTSASVPMAVEADLAMAYVVLHNELRGTDLDLRIRTRSDDDRDDVAAFSVLSAVREQLRTAPRSGTLEVDLDQVSAMPRIESQRIEEALPESRTFARLSGRVWAVLLAAPFVLTLASMSIPLAVQAARGTFEPSVIFAVLLDPICLALFLPLLAFAAAPRPGTMRGRIAQIAGTLLLAMVLPYAVAALWVIIMETLRGNSPTALLAEAMRSRVVVVNRFLYLAIAGGLLALHYSARAREREAERELLRARLAEAQLSTLKMQLHPHFLFNTLNAIAGMLEENPGAARVMTERLARFLQRSLSAEDTQEVPLREELAFVMTYLEIQRARFGERLQLEVDVDDDVLETQVPALVLQPLIENSVRHGIAPRKEGGTIRLSASRRGDMTVIRIEDDGAGMPLQTLSIGLGLSNTAARLRQLYGSRQKLAYRSRSGNGFEVELLVPRFARE